jgi:uncharacterized membrane protein required for colicin V production
VTFGPYDLVALVVLLAGFVHGRTKGFAWQLSGIATLALGYAAATAGAVVLSPLFPDAWTPDLKRFAAWVVTFAIVSVAVYFVTLRLSKKIKEHELEELDKRFGGALGALKAGLILAAVSLVAIASSERALGLVKESASGQLLARAAFAARPVLPTEIGKAVARVAGRIIPEDDEGPPPRGAPRVQPLMPVTKPIKVPSAVPPKEPPPPIAGTQAVDPPREEPMPLPQAPAAGKPEAEDHDHEDSVGEPPEPRDPLAPPPR